MTIRWVWHIALILLGGIGGTLMAPTEAAALTCPAATANMAGNAPSLGDLYSGANDITAGDRLGVLVNDLRKGGMKPALIVDNLVGSYCSLVAADGSLSDKQKTDRVRRFAQQVTGLAYVPSERDEEDILVQTAVEPSLLNQMDQAAGRAGISRDEWIARAIKRQLAEP